LINAPEIDSKTLIEWLDSTLASVLKNLPNLVQVFEYCKAAATDNSDQLIEVN
jgi:hypothetical protein